MITALTKKRTVTAKTVICPECGTKTKVYNSKIQDGSKSRYRCCPNCSHKFKTMQDLKNADSPEVIVPYEEVSAIRQRNFIRGGGNSKLTVSDVKKIRKMWEESEYKDMTDRLGIAEEFNVKDRAIRNILTGKSWAYVA